MNIYVSFGRTESGDDLPVLAFRSKPTDARVEALYREQLPEEFEEGAPGFVSFQVVKAELNGG